jgi:hypothetical protein
MNPEDSVRLQEHRQNAQRHDQECSEEPSFRYLENSDWDALFVSVQQKPRRLLWRKVVERRDHEA